MDEHAHDTIALVLELMWVRSMVRVGLGLLHTYPTEAAWQQGISDHAFLDMCAPVAAAMTKARMLVQLGGLLSPEDVQTAYTEMFAAAVESIGPLADHLGVDREDLLSVLVQTEGRYAARTEIPAPPEDDSGARGDGGVSGDPGGAGPGSESGGEPVL